MRCALHIPWLRNETKIKKWKTFWQQSSSFCFLFESAKDWAENPFSFPYFSPLISEFRRFWSRKKFSIPTERERGLCFFLSGPQESISYENKCRESEQKDHRLLTAKGSVGILWFGWCHPQRSENFTLLGDTPREREKEMSETGLSLTMETLLFRRHNFLKLRKSVSILFSSYTDDNVPAWLHWLSGSNSIASCFSFNSRVKIHEWNCSSRR